MNEQADPSPFALVLAGHGSQESSETAGVVWRAVDRLREQKAAHEITAAFWKEPPTFSGVLRTIESRNVWVVPIFASHGYFVETVIPTELQAGNRYRAHQVTMTPPICQRPELQDVICERLNLQLSDFTDPNELAIVVIGHGTKRDSNSRASTDRLVERLRNRAIVREVVGVFLEDDPPISLCYQLTNAPIILAVANFISFGSHASEDVPRALGLDDGCFRQSIRGRDVIYVPPLLDDELISTLALKSARENGFPSMVASSGTGLWKYFPLAGHRTFLDLLAREQQLRIGELVVTTRTVTHPGDTDQIREIVSPTQLREVVRNTSSRPNPYARGMPTGWQVQLTQPSDAAAVVETIYPGMIADDFGPQSRSVTSLQDTISRQQGMLRQLIGVPPALVERAVESHCSQCTRAPVWHSGAFFEMGNCLEPCPYLLTQMLREAKRKQP